MANNKRMLWPCTVVITATMPGGRQRTISVKFDADEGNGNIRENAIFALRQRMRKQYLWYGVGFIVHKPFNTTIEGVFEDECN